MLQPYCELHSPAASCSEGIQASHLGLAVLHAGIVRPTAHSLPMVGHNLLAEMASQLGKLTQLASELKSENQQLVSAQHSRLTVSLVASVGFK